MPREEWLPVAGYEGLYEVSSLGGVRSLDRTVQLYNGGSYTRRGAAMHPTKDTFGHLQVSLTRNGKSAVKQVHILVATAFLGTRPHGYHTRHLNGDPTDNRVANLAYGTASENQIDRWRYAKNQVFRKLSVQDVLDIRALAKAGVSHRKIAKSYPVCPQQIDRIVSGERCSHINDEGVVI